MYITDLNKHFIALQHENSLEPNSPFMYCSFTGAGLPVPPTADQRRQREATMELKMRLNVLAAIMSFGFVAAIVLGML
jgi:hypothetical protein